MVVAVVFVQWWWLVLFYFFKKQFWLDFLFIVVVGFVFMMVVGFLFLISLNFFFVLNWDFSAFFMISPWFVMQVWFLFDENVVGLLSLTVWLHMMLHYDYFVQFIIGFSMDIFCIVSLIIMPLFCCCTSYQRYRFVVQIVIDVFSFILVQIWDWWQKDSLCGTT